MCSAECQYEKHSHITSISVYKYEPKLADGRCTSTECIETNRNHDQNATAERDLRAHRMWNRYDYTDETVREINTQLDIIISSKTETNLYGQKGRQ